MEPFFWNPRPDVNASTNYRFGAVFLSEWSPAQFFADKIGLILKTLYMDILESA